MEAPSKVLENFLQFGWLQEESNHKFQIQIKIIFKPKCIVKFIKALNWEERKNWGLEEKS